MIVEILEYLDKNEIDYRLESDHCNGYIFTFVDGSVYPRRWVDSSLNNTIDVVAESVDNIIEKTVNNCVQKDWTHRVYGESLCDVFEKVEKHLFG